MLVTVMKAALWSSPPAPLGAQGPCLLEHAPQVLLASAPHALRRAGAPAADTLLQETRSRPWGSLCLEFRLQLPTPPHLWPAEPRLATSWGPRPTVLAALPVAFQAMVPVCAGDWPHWPPRGAVVPDTPLTPPHQQTCERAALRPGAGARSYTSTPRRPAPCHLYRVAVAGGHGAQGTLSRPWIVRGTLSCGVYRKQTGPEQGHQGCQHPSICPPMPMRAIVALGG